MLKFLKSPPLLAATGLIVLQGALIYSAIRPESIPAGRPLSQLPQSMGSWKFAQEGLIDADTQAVLKADDLLNRYYIKGPLGANLFVAAFRSQRNGKAPHSPKNCLPGSGWIPSQSGMIEIPISQETNTIRVNRYVVARGQNESVVLYWYQARNRIIASEYSAKVFTVVDAIRYNRTDTSLVRVVVGVNEGNTRDASDAAVSFVQSFFRPLRRYLLASY